MRGCGSRQNCISMQILILQLEQQQREEKELLCPLLLEFLDNIEEGILRGGLAAFLLIFQLTGQYNCSWRSGSFFCIVSSYSSCLSSRSMQRVGMLEQGRHFSCSFSFS